MQISFGIREGLALLVLLGLTVSYVLGWTRLRRAMPKLAAPWRLLAFSLASLALLFALVIPLPSWSYYLLAMRSLQKAFICMIAAPLFWLSVPLHTIAWGWRGPMRRLLLAMRGPSWFGKTARALSHPLVTWFAFVTTFLIWHDPTLARFFLEPGISFHLMPWILLSSALLFWWPVVDSGPRYHRGLPEWLLLVYLFSVEVANMAAGITIAFSSEPIYAHYPQLRAQLPADALPWNVIIDQIAGGAIVWVFGSLVYISSIVFVLLRLFRKEGSNAPEHLPNWDDNAKFIAPGLEHRVKPNALGKIDLNHR